MVTLEIDGYEVHRAVLRQGELEELRDEVDRVATDAGSACVRNLGTCSSLFAELAVDPRLLRLVPDGLAPVRSLLFDKNPERNWPVQWHQDLTIAVDREVDIPGYGPWSKKGGVTHVQPPTEVLQSMVTLRIHLDDASAENGALWVCPGTHRRRSLTAEDAQAHVICECLAGDVLVMSPLILHSSRRSSNPHRRRVVHFEYARLDSLDPGLSWYEATSS